MNCTEKEFETIVWSKYPHKHMYEDTSTCPGHITIFALDTLGEYNKNYIDKYKIASHIWVDGAVAKDSDNLFTQTSHTIVNTTTSPITFTMPSGVPNHMFTLPAGYTVIDNIGNWNPIFLDPPPPPKCECGAHKVGSNMHSSWCGLGDHRV